jgi:hypothetical protein
VLARVESGLVALIACVLALSLAPAARADGDPASDYLTQIDVYYGYGIDVASKPAQQLPVLLASARAGGYPLKVALITDVAALGSVVWLWHKPQEYARYLGEELGFVYKGRVLVVMPNGLALYHDGLLPGKERRVLERLKPPGTLDDFLPLALRAAERLAAADGVKATLPRVLPPPASGVQQGAGNPVVPAPGPVIGLHATVTPTARLRAPGGGASAPWLFLVPACLFVLAAGTLAVSRRRRLPLDVAD